MSSDPLIQYLLQGDLLGFATGLYTRLFKEPQMFYVVLILLFSVPLYVRTQSFGYVCILWTLLGGLLIGMVPVSGFQLGWVLLVIGVAGILYQALR